MISMVRMTYLAQNQSGRETVTVAKTKEVRFASENEFRGHVAELMASGRCAITGLILMKACKTLSLSRRLTASTQVVITSREICR